MKKKYDKEIDVNVDQTRKIECINLSIGAKSREDFSWIANNFECFLDESIQSYNTIFSSTLREEKMKLYLIVQEQNDIGFSTVELHLGIWHKFNGVAKESKSQTFYANKNFRYAYTNIHCLGIDQLAMLQCGFLVFLKDGFEIADCLQEISDGINAFDILYDKCYLLVRFRNLFTEGNAMVFYSKNKRSLRNIVSAAKKENFIANRE